MDGRTKGQMRVADPATRETQHSGSAPDFLELTVLVARLWVSWSSVQKCSAMTSSKTFEGGGSIGSGLFNYLSLSRESLRRRLQMSGFQKKREHDPSVQRWVFFVRPLKESDRVKPELRHLLVFYPLR